MNGPVNRSRGLIHQSAGAQYTAIRHCERLGDVGAVASIGSVGDSYDNAMAESVVGLCKTTINRMITYGVKYSPPPLPSWAAKFERKSSWMKPKASPSSCVGIGPKSRSSSMGDERSSFW